MNAVQESLALTTAGSSVCHTAATLCNMSATCNKDWDTPAMGDFSRLTPTNVPYSRQAEDITHQIPQDDSNGFNSNEIPVANQCRFDASDMSERDQEEIRCAAQMNEDNLNWMESDSAQDGAEVIEMSHKSRNSMTRVRGNSFQPLAFRSEMQQPIFRNEIQQPIYRSEKQQPMYRSEMQQPTYRCEMDELMRAATAADQRMQFLDAERRSAVKREWDDPQRIDAGGNRALGCRQSRGRGRGRGGRRGLMSGQAREIPDELGEHRVMRQTEAAVSKPRGTTASIPSDTSCRATCGVLANEVDGGRVSRSGGAVDRAATQESSSQGQDTSVSELDGQSDERADESLHREVLKRVVSSVSAERGGRGRSDAAAGESAGRHRQVH